MTAPVLYFDLASPYGYLAVSRAERVFGLEPQLEPVLLGAIMGYRGWGSWALTEKRDENVADIEARAARYGVPLMWPAKWPMNSLAAMRAATWAKREGAGAAFAHAAYARHFGRGEAIEEPAVLAEIADEVGLDGATLAAAIADPELKLALRETTDAAWAAGVQGVPTTRVADAVYFGDDRLEDAARG